MTHSTFYLILYLTITSWEAQTVRNFRRNADAHPPTDWELGLREAVHQALLREHHTDPGLRDHLLEAPLIGRHDTASPFGDIAVLARGQLYATPEGFKFVQDSDRDDCVGVPQCQLWKSLGHHHKLIALWTVKRIRHRDPRYGHVYEIEYTISPITPAINEQLVRRHGFFDYNVPGHIFVIKSNPREDKWYNGIVIGVTPDGYKHVLHSFPGFYSSYHPQIDQTTIDPKEYELYKKLIESLAAKTSNLPHRFSPMTKPSHFSTTLLPVPQTTYSQISDRQFGTLEPPKPITMPVTTTIHYYTPVETTKTTPTKTTTTKYTTKTTTSEEEEIDIFPVVSSTEPMTPITELPRRTRPDSINEQLPAPDKNTDTTVPYAITVTQPTVKTEKVTIIKPVKNEATSVTQKLTSTYVPPVTNEESTIVERIPYTEGRTTLIRPVTTTTVIETIPSRVIGPLPITTTPYEQKTTTTITRGKSTTPYEIRTTPYHTTTTRGKSTTPYEVRTTPYDTTTTRGKSTTPYETRTTPYHTTTTRGKSTTPYEVRTTSYDTTTTRGKSTTPYETRTTVIEKIPYEEKTTIIRPFTSTTEETSSTYGTTFVEAIPFTTTQITDFTHSKPTTVFEYSFDLTEKPTTTTNTSPLTTHYFYTFETELPKTTHSETPPPTTSTTTKSDFLVDSKTPQKIPNKDIDIDDIFGAPPQLKTSPNPVETTKPVTQSDLSRALFGNRRPKKIKISSRIRKPTTSPPKIIYNNFYVPSTSATSTLLGTTSGFESTTEIKPSTDQSFSTSISFEVNKRNSTKRNETKEAFDDLALQLVNHARSIEYMQKKPTKQVKYRRRSFATRKSAARKIGISKKRTDE